MDKLLATLKGNRHGHRDWLVGLIIYRHGLRVSEACDLRWDDIDLQKRIVIVRRLKGSTDSVHYLDRDGWAARSKGLSALGQRLVVCRLAPDLQGASVAVSAKYP